MAEPPEKRDRSAAQEGRKSLTCRVLEWSVAGLGAILLLGTVVFLTVQAFRTHGEVPEISVTQEQITPLAEGYVVSVVAHNRGDVAAADVHLQGELRQGAEVLETAELTLDYVPSHSNTRGGLVFERNPAEHELKLKVSGYQEP